jgi:hypothetical protein
MAVDTEGRIHATWWQATAPEGEPVGMVHRMSSDGGDTFSPPEAFDPSAAVSHSLVADGQGGVLWLGQDGTYRAWNLDDGWSDAAQADGDAGLGGARLTVGPDGGVLVSFPAFDGVYVARSTESGRFDEVEVVQGTEGVGFAAAAVAVDNEGTEHAVTLTSADEPVLTYLVLV